MGSQPAVCFIESPGWQTVESGEPLYRIKAKPDMIFSIHTYRFISVIGFKECCFSNWACSV